MLGIFKRENTTASGESSRAPETATPVHDSSDGATNASASEPASDPAGDMENRIAALSEAEAGISCDIENTKWAALEEQQARASAARAELEQAEARLSQYRADLEAHECAETESKVRAENLPRLATIAGQQAARVQTIGEALGEADEAVRALRAAVVKVIATTFRYREVGYSYAQIKSETPGDKAALAGEVAALCASPRDITMARRDFDSGFSSSSFRGNGIFATKGVSLLTFQLIEALLSDDEVQKAIEAATQRQFAAAWFPPDKSRVAPRNFTIVQ